MTTPEGETEVISQIRPKNGLGFATFRDSDGEGGFAVVELLSDLDDMHESKLVVGMRRLVQEDGNEYKLTDADPITWVLYAPSSDSIAAHVAAADPHAQYQKESEKGAVSGYASLDGSGTVPDAQIPSTIARDTEVTAAVATHVGLSDPHAQYQKESEKSVANGYASLDSGGKVPDAEIPSTIARDTEITVAVDAHVAAGNPHPVYATDAEVTVIAAALDAAHVAASDPHVGYQKESEKGAAGGYASLDGGGKIPDSEIPAAIARDTEITAAVDAHVAASDPHVGYQKESEKGAVSGYASLDGSGTVPDAQIPSTIARDTEITSAISTHEAAGNPHPVYTTDAEATAIADAAVATHAGLSDPHVGYQKESEKGAVSGYASLDGSGTVPDAQIPSTIARDTEITAAVDAHVAASDPHTGYQKESEKSAAGGYASLDGGGKVPDGELPSGLARDSEVTAAISAAVDPITGSDVVTGSASSAFSAERVLTAGKNISKTLASGLVTMATAVTSFVVGSVVSPTPATDQNDFSPTGWNDAEPAQASVIRLNPSASIVISGLAGGTAGRIAILVNVSDFLVILPQNSALSAAANRFDDPTNPTGLPTLLCPSDSVTLQYDGTAACWRQIDGRSLTDRFDVLDDMIGAAAVAAGAPLGQGRSVLSGVLAATANAGFLETSTEKPWGVLGLDTGTDAAGRASIAYGGAGSIVCQTGALLFLTRVAPTTLSDVTNRYILIAGFTDGVNSAPPDPIDGYYWAYRDDVSANWLFGVRAASAALAETASSLAVSVSEYHWLGIFVNKAGTRADFFLSSDSVTWTFAGSKTTGMPTANTGTGVTIGKTVGITSRRLNVDLVAIKRPGLLVRG